MAALDGNGDRAGLAAEFALGTLDESERRSAQALYDTDPAFARAVDEWRRRLATLSEATPAIAPPDGLFASVMQRIGVKGDNVIALRRKISFWRGATAAAAALAAALLLVIALPSTRPAAPQHFVAVLQAGGKSPAFIASVDVAHGLIGIRRVDAPAAAGHSYELWALGAGRAAPQPLGVIDAVARIPTERLKKLDRSQLRDTTFAISLEPEGGSPTGLPTGPVLFVGKLIPTE